MNVLYGSNVFIHIKSVNDLQEWYNKPKSVGEDGGGGYYVTMVTSDIYLFIYLLMLYSSRAEGL